MNSRGYDQSKRAFDVVIAVLLFVLTLPIQAATALAIRIRLGSPVLFRQTRPGLHGEPFEIIKFRTMLDDDPPLGLIDDASRMTPLGLWLRGTSIDELPTLWNVIRGDLSLVGPRPLMLRYPERYSPEQARRHEVPPGISGLAQVSGRNELSWEDKFRLDVYYVDHHTFRGDLKILSDTVGSVARRDGISAAGETTTSEFLGTDDQKKKQVTAPLFIIGAGGFGREVFSIIATLEGSGSVPHPAGFIDDAPSPADVDSVEALGSRVVGSITDLARRTEPFGALLAVSSSTDREAIAGLLAHSPVTYPVLVHPHATIGCNVDLSEGVIAAPGSRLSTNIRVGRHVHIDQNTAIGHDCNLGDFSRLNPQACVSGNVTIGRRAMIGANAIVLQGLTVGDDAIVGAGAVVTHSVDADVTVMAAPARRFYDVDRRSAGSSRSPRWPRPSDNNRQVPS
jgi:sugar O-acyltransferase (sialic acid O-acetyltransferase NeuD family)